LLISIKFNKIKGFNEREPIKKKSLSELQDYTKNFIQNVELQLKNLDIKSTRELKREIKKDTTNNNIIKVYK